MRLIKATKIQRMNQGPIIYTLFVSMMVMLNQVITILSSKIIKQIFGESLMISVLMFVQKSKYLNMLMEDSVKKRHFGLFIYQNMRFKTHLSLIFTKIIRITMVRWLTKVYNKKFSNLTIKIYQNFTNRRIIKFQFQ